MASNTNNANASSINIHTNFNPSWMQQTIPIKSAAVALNNQQKSQASVEETQTCDPIFSKYSYGREDLLAMMEKLKMEAPNGLEKCPFFVKTPHTPVVLLPLTETEMRLQQNINSSKAMSAFNRTQGYLNSDNITMEAAPGTGWTSTNAGQNRQGQGTNGPTKKFGQSQESKQQPSTTNRWSGLASSTGGNLSTAAAQKPSWKTAASNVGSTSGNIERVVNMRDKSTSFNQMERNVESTAKKQPQMNIQPEDELLDGFTKNESNIPVPADSKESMKSTTTPPIAADRNNLMNDASSLQQQKSMMTQAATEFIEPPQQYQPQKWTYLDPTGVQRGPFDSQQMQAWFSSGYFTSSLQVRQVGDKNYISLGELYLINGEKTPFISKKEQNLSKTIDSSTNSNPHQKQHALEGTEMRNSNKATIGHHIPHRISPSVLLAGSTKRVNKLGLDVERIWAATPLEDVGMATGTFIGGTNNANNDINVGGNNNNNTHQDSPAISSTGFAHSAFSQHLKEIELEKILQTREVQILEEQRKLRDKEELFRREEQERMEKERRMQEMEIDLKRKQEEFDRIAREKDTEFEKRCIQMAEYERKKREELAALEQRIISEQQRQQLRIEEEDRRRAKELQDILTREQERQRQYIDEEMKRKQEEQEARLRLSMQEAQHMKELELEQVKKTKEEQRRRQIDEQQRQQQIALEEARADYKRQQEIATKAEAFAKAEQERMTAKKWQTIHSAEQYFQPAIQPPTKIQQQHLQEQPQQQRSAWQTVSPIAADKPIQMNIPSQPEKQQQPQQYTTTVEQRAERRGWQQVSVPKAAPIPPAVGKNTNSNASAKQAEPKKQQQQQKGAKAKGRGNQQPNVEDKLTEWICKRLRELNSSVDAEVFANFIAQVDSPNEAEDYIIGYLGDKKEVKDFHREFLSKRIELRPRVQQTHKDDLSRPAAALNADMEAAKSGGGSNNSNQRSAGVSATNQNFNNGNAKKKKQKKVLDASNLGFTAISNPNRINAGEIDRVPPPLIPGTNKKR